ncbi:src kinase-associated phosphoprotein 2 [Plectropomus leopardus]|uniref:src kinase-associated phosphoprotein 2 n=1 Tax=Plectropomus leopardus TaxID=160734 RepID=UPI001C4A8233|nr:src kinase-associated phosphoprotein 2 [Plectropomus leopardus]XP_042346563.1 src kinase-associated phosphoprotein 2 [Plectropomus leopardus]
MRAIPEELTTLISDLEYFLSDGLKGENLSKKAKEKREAFIKRIKEVKLGFPQDFKDKSGDDSDDSEEVDSNNDGGSLQSERTDKDEEACEGAQQSPPVAAQDLTSVFKAGYLEKRRKDHSFFGTEWQKRWCALSHHIFYYYGSEKDKQQKGEFSIDGYTVKMNSTLRKDSKKDCCFEISAPDKRVYQFCASSVKEAEEWVKQIDFVLRDMSGIIPVDEEEEQEVYDDVGQIEDADESEPIDEDIYEELPEDDVPTKPPPKVEPASKPAPPAPVDKSTDYPNFYQGLWDCTGDHPDELSFKRGDAIYVLSKEYQNFGWWVGEKDGTIGIVPKEFLMELYAL